MCGGVVQFCGCDFGTGSRCGCIGADGNNSRCSSGFGLCGCDVIIFTNLFHGFSPDVVHVFLVLGPQYSGVQCIWVTNVTWGACVETK